jgi:nitrite reductase (NADH) large subunit
MDCLIIGGGVAGFQAAFSSRRDWPEKSVTLIEAEGEAGYYRTLLPPFMAGQLGEEKLFFWQPEEDPLFHVRLGERVLAVNPGRRRVTLGNGEDLRYERLILAPGGRPFLPEVCAKQYCPGMFSVRDLTTARKIKVWIAEHRNVVVLGGGLVGVKTAVYLRLSGLEVSLVEKEGHLLPQALSPAAAAPVEAHLERMGIRLYLASTLNDIDGEKGTLRSVQAGEKRFPCNTLLVAIGSSPDVAFLQDSGLLENGELIVSHTLQTRDQKIFAAGDAVRISAGEGNKVSPWIWPQAVAQGKLAGTNVYESVPRPLRVLTRPNSMNLHGLSLAILGPPVAGAERMCFASPSQGAYRELFLSGGRVVGGALIGDLSAAGPLQTLMASGKEIGLGAADLLRDGGKVLSLPPGDGGARRRRAKYLLNWS